jgi:hypothetical protein
MSNVRTISQEDLDNYPSLKGRKVGDVITAEEDAKLRASDRAVEGPVEVAAEEESGNEGKPMPKSKKK